LIVVPETKHDDAGSSRVRATHVKGADATRDAEEREKEAAEQAEREAQEAAAQSERDAGDVETFLSAHRGEQLLRGPGGSFDHAAYTAARERERVENEQDDSSDSGSTP
jgi:hypothetical protein